jgi:cyclophilin family peptidyl-prolyl cis-trans isomerase
LIYYKNLTVENQRENFNYKHSISVSHSIFLLNSRTENSYFIMKRLSILVLGCATALIFCNASGCKSKSESSSKTDATVIVNEPPPAPPAPPEVKPETLAFTPSEKYKDMAIVRVKTKFGDMLVALYNETPKHRDNFLKLVSEKYYDGLLFHRCIRNFMVQGGDPNSRGAASSVMLGNGGPGYTIPAEFNPNLIHKKGALAAARQGDQVNPKKESSGSQFYIAQGTVMNDMQLDQNQANIARMFPAFKYTDEARQLYKTIGGTANLDMNYTVFGEVIDGLQIVDLIAQQPTARGDRPLEDVTMNMEIVQKNK